MTASGVNQQGAVDGEGLVGEEGVPEELLVCEKWIREGG